MPQALVRASDLLLPTRATSGRGQYFIQTWGCQMNEEDSVQMARYLEEAGFAPARTLRDAQVVLLNTCSVRSKPEQKAFSMLGEVGLLKREKPELIVGVCGCMAQLRSDEIKRRAPFVDFVIGTGQIATLPGLVEEAAQARKFRTRLALPERKGAVVTDVPRRIAPPTGSSAGWGKLKAFVPIQYGCDKFCTFCIVPTTRGRERSRPTEDIVGEVRQLAQRGAKEVTLLGQTVNSYGRNLAEGRVPFSKLLWLLAGISGLERIRYTSPYPRDFKEDLIECIRECPQVMEHVHLPLQSGDDEVLKEMRRQYTLGSFAQILENLRVAVPDLGVTTDLIVGFPGETEEMFRHTMAAVERFQFDGAFMFAYSPRPGTPAADREQVPGPVKKRRLLELIELQTSITLRRNESRVGRVLEVLVEGPSRKNPTRFEGYSREFTMVHFPGDPEQIGRLVRVEATAAHLWGVSGRIVEGA